MSASSSPALSADGGGDRGWLVVAALLAVLLNGVLFGAAALLSRERPVRPDMTRPVGVRLVTLKPVTPPAPPPPREEPPPRETPPLDFTPALTRPRPAPPAPLDIRVHLDPTLFRPSSIGGSFVFQARDLDSPPAPRVQTRPVYPFKARQRNIEGYVKVKFLVEPDGSVGKVSVLEARPAGVFDKAALQAARHWKFRPGMLDGKPVASWVALVITFQLD